MTSDIKKYWMHGQVDLTATTSTYKVCNLNGGESVTIKALAANSGNVYIGSSRDVSTTTGFELDASQTLTLTLPASFGKDNFIEIYAVTDNAGDDVCYIKLIDLEPETAAAG